VLAGIGISKAFGVDVLLALLARPDDLVEFQHQTTS
jgi:hypothetical protein